MVVEYEGQSELAETLRAFLDDEEEEQQQQQQGEREGRGEKETPSGAQGVSYQMQRWPARAESIAR